MTTKRIPMKSLALASTAVVLATVVGQAQAQAFRCPRTGGDLIFALGSKVPRLDQHTSDAGATRNVALNVYESLVTRDESMNPVLELAETMTVSPDGKNYTFKLRQGIQFHNGKTMTSADVMASFGRYKRAGGDRSNLPPVDQ